MRWSVVVGGVIGLAASARAGIVFEYHPRERPAAIEPALVQLLDELEQDGRFVARTVSVRAALGPLAGAPALSDRGVTAPELLANITVGYKAYLDGRYEQAIAQLAAAIELGHANPALVVSASKYRLAMLDALVGLSASYHRRNRGADRTHSVEVMQELIRSFPDRLASLRDTYGPEPDGIYKLAARQQQGTGSLVVAVDDPAALIYLNEVEPPQSAAFRASVPAGRYRVLVKTAASDGRRYELEVKPNETTKLSVRWAMTAALSASERWVGFSGVPERTAVLHASELAVQLGHVLFVLVRQTTSERGVAIEAAIYRARDGKLVRSHAAALDGQTSARVSALARVLRAEGPFADGGGKPRVVAAVSVSPRRRRRWLASGVALGVAGLAGGAVAIDLALDGSTRPAIVTGIASGVALAGGITLALVGRSRHSAPVVLAPRRDGALVMCGWSFR